MGIFPSFRLQRHPYARKTNTYHRAFAPRKPCAWAPFWLRIPPAAQAAKCSEFLKQTALMRHQHKLASNMDVFASHADAFTRFADWPESWRRGKFGMG